MKVLITGASSGIGLELAKIFAKNSYDLVLVARRLDRLIKIKDDLEKEYGVAIMVEAIDLLEISSLEPLANKHQDVDVLVNNAGFGRFESFTKYDANIDQNMIDLNITTPSLLTKYFIKSMKKHSTIVNIASTAAFQPVPYMAVYSATKSYLVDFTLAIAKEIKDMDILLYCPGETKTEFHSVANRPISGKLRGPIPEAKEVAEDIYWAIINKKRYRIYGRYNRFLRIFSKLLPKNLIALSLAKTNEKNWR